MLQEQLLHDSWTLVAWVVEGIGVYTSSAGDGRDADEGLIDPMLTGK